MKEKKPVGPHKLLKICRRLFFSGALTMLTAAYLIGEPYQWRGNPDGRRPDAVQSAPFLPGLRKNAG